MENAMIMAFVLFADEVVTRALGAALIGAAVCGTVAAGRWVKAQHAADTSGGAVALSGSYYAKIAAIMTVGLAGLFAGVALMTW